MIISQHSIEIVWKYENFLLSIKILQLVTSNITFKNTVSRKITIIKLGIWYLFWTSYCGWLLPSYGGYCLLLQTILAPV